MFLCLLITKITLIWRLYPKILIKVIADKAKGRAVASNVVVSGYSLNAYRVIFFL